MSSKSELKQEGTSRIIQCGRDRGVSDLHLSYVLATVEHETAGWMQPIREGAIRSGPDYSDASAQRAVASIHAKGVIRENYALPAGPYKKSYYGRGLVQITFYENYRKFGIAKDPDKALEWETALRILFDGMIEGSFTGKSLKQVESAEDFYNARDIINGDRKRNGSKIANMANKYLKLLGDTL